jgi:hypothetical protein
VREKTMPEAEEILASLERITNGATAVAIAWHVVLFVTFAAIVAGFRPSRRALAWMSLLPVLSVSAVAHWYEARFNGFVFVVLTAVLAFSIPRGKDEKIRRGPPWAVVLGSAMIAFAWTYPHFLDASRSPFAYLYAAPVGLIPCPTLSLVIGVTLVTGASTGTRGAIVLAAAGLFYGFVGLVKLNVEIDAVLVAGALGLLALALRSTATPIRTETEKSPSTS